VKRVRTFAAALLLVTALLGSVGSATTALLAGSNGPPPSTYCQSPGVWKEDTQTCVYPGNPYEWT
jgi:hypothetical protein